MVYVPDAGHAKLIELCHRANDIKTTVLTTEEEGIGRPRRRLARWRTRRAADAEQRPSAIASTRLSLAKVCGFPLVLIVTMRGQWGETNPWQVADGADHCRQPASRRRHRYEINEPDMAGPAVEAAGRIAFNGGTNRCRAAVRNACSAPKLFKD